MDEYYKILELRRGASIEQIKAAKKKLLQICHPDYFQRSDLDLARIAEERTKLINDAYDKLIENLETGQQPPTKHKQPPSGNKNDSNTQKEHSQYQAEQERQHREKAEQERIAKKQAAKQERIAREKAKQEAFRQEQRKRAIRTVLFALCALSIVFILSLKWFVTTDYAKGIYEWWTDPHYYAPRLTKEWVRMGIPRNHHVLIKPVDTGAKIEIRLDGDDSQKEIVTDRREVHFKFQWLKFGEYGGLVDVRAASPESVGKRYYVYSVHD